MRRSLALGTQFHFLFEGLADGCEQPRLRVDGGGNLVMFFRGFTLPPSLHDPKSKQMQEHIESRQGAARRPHDRLGDFLRGFVHVHVHVGIEFVSDLRSREPANALVAR